MKRSNAVLVFELLLLTAVVFMAAFSPVVGTTWTEVGWFVAGMVVLTFSDVWLPRGDAIGMSSSLTFSSLLLFDVRIVLGMMVFAELVALMPSEARRDWRRAVSSLAVKSAATIACSSLLVLLGLHPVTGVLRDARVGLGLEQHVFVLLLGGLFASLEFGGTQLETAARRDHPIRATVLGGFSFGVWLIAAQASAGVLAALMYRTMGAWGLALAVLMILIMRQAFVLLLDIRQAYGATIDVLVKAMEVQSPGREGLAERNAALSTQVGRALGIHGPDLERLRYAGLLLGLGVEVDDDESGRTQRAEERGRSASIVEGVEFLSHVVPILELCDAPALPRQVRRNDLISAYIVTAVGAFTGTVSQERLAQLRRRVSPRIAAEVDEALVDAIAAGASTLSATSSAG